MFVRLNADRLTAAGRRLVAALTVGLLCWAVPAAAQDALDKLQERALERYLKELGSRRSRACSGEAERRRSRGPGLAARARPLVHPR